jgi:hypothetical protein
VDRVGSDASLAQVTAEAVSQPVLVFNQEYPHVLQSPTIL